MMKKLFYLSVVFLWLFLGFNINTYKTTATEEETTAVYPVRIFLFHSVSCPHCHEELKFLEKLEKEHNNLEIHRLEVSKDFKNQNIFAQVIDKYEKINGGVPVTIIGDQITVGFDNERGIGRKIEQKILACSEEVCNNTWLDEKLGFEEIREKTVRCSNEKHRQNKTGENCEDNENDKIKVFGWQVNEEKSIFILGAVLGLADGINPCMFSVLIFLLTYLMAIGSKKKAIKAGVSFVVTTFALYFIFMLGIIKIVDVLSIADWLRTIIILVSFLAGIIMLKDFFFYGKWISLEIPQKYKPKIENLVKKGTVISAIVLALFAGLVELPCTSGIPLAYITIITSRGLNSFWPLIIYNLFFILPLLIIILGVGFAWTKIDAVEKSRLKFRKYMRLVAGLLLIFLAWALWMNWL